MANEGGNIYNEAREYRKGNWTVEETMVLIEAKKMDDERRLMIRYGESSSTHERGKPAELRWKRVEDYCWKNGCFRSQNQCNDKWDNLMRDFKKVREYHKRVAEISGAGGGGGGEKSYWNMDKNERKEHSLPSNMLPQIFDALVEVVERKGTAAVGGGGFGTSNVNVLSTPLQQPIPAAAQSMRLPLPPPAQPITRPFAEPSFPTVDSDTSGNSESPAKRRRRRRSSGGGGATAGGSSLQEVCSAISQNGSIIAEAIQSCEEREERRHRELLSLHERRLQIEESNAQINRQGINGLVDAINKLANSILALVSHKNQPDSK
ncbi:Homeodomain-like superfamily protein [Abeliophyllum distichum]|uniref:Homeodomain-like superfamily protein n=1 Tax=Abeliophyllum distichum TaxID=126358 RepID=A0ABD1QEX2_9LAMI